MHKNIYHKQKILVSRNVVTPTNGALSLDTAPGQPVPLHWFNNFFCYGNLINHPHIPKIVLLSLFPTTTRGLVCDILWMAC